MTYSIMKKHFLSVVLISFALLNIGCKKELTEPVINTEELKQSKWEVVPELSNLSVRYILKHNETLYLSAVESGKNYKGIIWKTSNGINWTIVRTFEKVIGPLTINGDTLYCLGDSLYRYIIPINKWENVCKPWPLTSDPGAMGDMIFVKDELYAMQSLFADAVATYRISFDGTINSLPVHYGREFGGAKFIKSKSEMKETVYVRGQYYKYGFFTFDGNVFSPIKDGLTEFEYYNPPTNSLALKNDTLYAGFMYPAVVKRLINNQWQNFTDTLPYSSSAFQFNPPIKTETTAIIFVENRMFVATQAIGVLEWEDNKGWRKISEGLIPDPLINNGYKDLFRPVVFLENINGILIAAYGKPGYAQWGEFGVYKLALKNIK